jgi:RNA polymerase sigma-70 factor, ECF subfamily
MFSVPFEQIGAILERSPQAARQLASRGRRRIRSAAPVPDADLSAQWEVVEAFVAAARDGDFEALLAVLDPEIVERVDTGSGTIFEVRGALNVARRALAFSQRDGLGGWLALVNGAPGWVSVLHGELYAIAALTVHKGRITTMDILLDPARLARLDLTDYFDPPL